MAGQSHPEIRLKTEGVIAVACGRHSFGVVRDPAIARTLTGKRKEIAHLHNGSRRIQSLILCKEPPLAMSFQKPHHIERPRQPVLQARSQ
jgi:hypothetical protein